MADFPTQDTQATPTPHRPPHLVGNNHSRFCVSQSRLFAPIGHHDNHSNDDHLCVWITCIHFCKHGFLWTCRIVGVYKNKMRIIDFLPLLKFLPQNCPSGPKSSMCTKAQIAAIQNQAKHKLEMVAIEMRACGQKLLKASAGSRALNREMSAMGDFCRQKVLGKSSRRSLVSTVSSCPASETGRQGLKNLKPRSNVFFRVFFKDIR